MATQISKTLNATSGDYTTVAGLDAAIPADLTTADENWTVTVTDSTQYIEVITMTHTADATRTLTMQAASGQIPSFQSAQTLGFHIQIANSTFVGLTFKGNVNKNAAYVSGGIGTTFIFCTFQSNTSSAKWGLQCASKDIVLNRCTFHTLTSGVEFSANKSGIILKNSIFRDITSRCVDCAVGSNSNAVYNNTMNPRGGHGIVFRTTTTPNTIVKNNCIRVTGASGWCIRVKASVDTALTSDENRLQALSSAKIGEINGTSYTTLADWQTQGQDASSAEGSFLWTNEPADDYTLTASDDGASGLGVTVDFDGTTRADPTDRGAYEYVSAGGGSAWKQSRSIFSSGGTQIF